MITRCCICHKDSIVHDRIYAEPLSKRDSTPMYTRGWMCDNCSIIHWAMKPDALDDSQEPMTEYL